MLIRTMCQLHAHLDTNRRLFEWTGGCSPAIKHFSIAKLNIPHCWFASTKAASQPEPKTGRGIDLPGHYPQVAVEQM